MVWHKRAVPLHQKLKNYKAMRNTDFNLDALGNFIACDASIAALKDIIRDLDLEFEDALAL